MNQLRIALAAVALVACAAPKASQSVAPVAAVAPAKPQCRFAVRRVSLPGRAGVRPQVAVAGDTFAVAWEEEADGRGVRLQILDADAKPIGAGVALSDGSGVGSDPRIVADGDGFAVFWTVDGTELSAIEMRRVDGHGIPRGAATAIVRAPGARALAAARVDGGFVVPWWNWNSTPHTLAATFVDEGTHVGRALAITDSPSADPTVDVAAPHEIGIRVTPPSILAWEQLVDGVDHIEVAQLGRTRLGEVSDLGRGESPELGFRRVIFERPEEAAIYTAPIPTAAGEKTETTRLIDGHTPAAARRGDGTALCFIRDTTLDDGHADELWCGDLVDGKMADATKVALASRGVMALQLAAGASQFAVAYQTQEEDDTSISFAALSCPDLGAAPQALR